MWDKCPMLVVLECFFSPSCSRTKKAFLVIFTGENCKMTTKFATSVPLKYLLIEGGIQCSKPECVPHPGPEFSIED